MKTLAENESMFGQRSGFMMLGPNSNYGHFIPILFLLLRQLKLNVPLLDYQDSQAKRKRDSRHEIGCKEGSLLSPPNQGYFTILLGKFFC